MKSNKILFLVMFVAFVVIACQLFGAGKPENATPVATPPPTGGYPASDISGYPLPTAVNPSYPPSGVTGPTAPAAPSVLYPEAKDGDEVTWTRAYAMILNDEVAKVVQTHDLKVYLTLKDGRTLVATQPAIDQVLDVIQECGEKCKDILVASE